LNRYRLSFKGLFSRNPSFHFPLSHRFSEVEGQLELGR
jgi:hypothetical protein